MSVAKNLAPLTVINKRPLRTLSGQGLITYIVYFMLFILYSLLVGYRGVDVGTDTITYMKLFEIFEYNKAISRSYEPGFIQYMLFIKSFSSDPRILIVSINVFISIFFCVSGLLLFKRNHILLYAILLLSSPFYFALSTNALRQGMAVSLCFFFFAIMLRAKYSSIYLAVTAFLVTLIHVPSLVSMLLQIKQIRRLRAGIFWVSAIFLGLFTNSYSSVLSNLFGNTKYVVYFNQSSDVFRTGLRIDFLIFSAIAAIVPILLDKKSFHNTLHLPIVYSAYFIINGIGMILNFLPFYSRILLASWCLLPLLFTLTFIGLNTQSVRNRVLKSIILLYTVIFAYIIFFLQAT